MNMLRVMTFNVRQPDMDDGENCWQNRRGLLVDTILSKQPDVIGTQELFQTQAEYIQERAPHYDWFGIGRYGTHEDKHVGIFYKKDRFRILSHGDLWLSETPEKPGSSSWNIIKPRQLTWGMLQSNDMESFYVFNTHFPYRAVEQEARLKTAQLIKERIRRLPSECPVILTTDANSVAGGDIYHLMCEDLFDAWKTAWVQTGPEGTLNGFGRHRSDRRIDWILYRSSWRVLDIETVIDHINGRYPSDHFPVMATFEVQP